MNRHKFIKNYCKGHRLHEDDFDKTWLALPCSCGDVSCDGWAAIRNIKEFLDEHARMEQLYAEHPL